MGKKQDNQPLWSVDDKALAAGGDAAGRYLDQIQKTELSELTAEEWRVFCRRMVGAALIAAVKDVYEGEAPF
jgi:hypothetical protein